MSNSRHALMSAIYTMLVGDGALGEVLAGDKVYDHVPRAASYPFIAFGEGQTRAADGDEVPTEQHQFELIVHSRAQGRQEASSISARVAELLGVGAFTLTGYRLGHLRLRDTLVAASRDKRAYRVRMRFEALTEIE